MERPLVLRVRAVSSETTWPWVASGVLSPRNGTRAQGSKGSFLLQEEIEWGPGCSGQASNVEHFVSDLEMFFSNTFGEKPQAIMPSRQLEVFFWGVCQLRLGIRIDPR